MASKAITILQAEVDRLRAAERPAAAEHFLEAIDILQQHESVSAQMIIEHQANLNRVTRALHRLAEITVVKEFRNRREGLYWNVLNHLSKIPNYTSAEQVREIALLTLRADTLGASKFKKRQSLASTPLQPCPRHAKKDSHRAHDWIDDGNGLRRCEGWRHVPPARLKAPAKPITTPTPKG